MIDDKCVKDLSRIKTLVELNLSTRHNKLDNNRLITEAGFKIILDKMRDL
jgi:hypothetical protein